MKLKSLITLLIVMAAITAALLFIKPKADDTDSDSKNAFKVGDVAFPNLERKDITALQISSPKSTLCFTKINEIWTLDSRGGFPINFTRLDSLIDSFGRCRVAESMEVSAKFIHRFQVAKPDSTGPAEEKGTHFNFKNAGKTLHSFTRGKRAEMGGYWYAIDGLEGQVLRLAEESSFFPEEEADWLETFHPGAIRSLSVTGLMPEENWKVYRESEAAPEWKLADPSPGEQPDSGKISTVGSAFASPDVKELIPEADKEKAGFATPTRKAVIDCFDGFTYTITVGAQIPIPDEEKDKGANEKYYVSVGLEANIPETRTPAPKPFHAEGTPEEAKKTADEEYAKSEAKLNEEYTKTKLPELKARAAREKVMAGFQFIMPKYSLDAIFKKRPDFMKDKPAGTEGQPGGIVPDPTAPLTPPTSTNTSPPVPNPANKPIEAVTQPISIDPKDLEEAKKKLEENKAKEAAPEENNEQPKAK